MAKDSYLQNRYIYKGPVYDRFDSMVETDWYGETTAPSLKKAISNLRWQYCRETDRFPYLNVGFDESRIQVEENPFKYRKDGFFGPKSTEVLMDYAEKLEIEYKLVHGNAECEQLKLPL